MMNQEELKAAEHLVDLALAEDVATGDITTDNLIPAEMTRKGFWRAKADGVVAGLQIAEMTFKKLDPAFNWDVLINDGERVRKGDLIVRFEGNYRAILTGERTALNFVQRLSGIAFACSINMQSKPAEQPITALAFMTW
jgi:nicotinate-nucleotide pyrophosphorylase (carboxylating)